VIILNGDAEVSELAGTKLNQKNVDFKPLGRTSNQLDTHFDTLKYLDTDLTKSEKLYFFLLKFANLFS
jgi:hypothetical protein